MSKRIIKNGKYNYVVCEECGCEFAFDQSDIEENGNIKCPQCDTECTPTKRV